MRSFLSRDFTPRLDRLYHLAAESRTGFYPINGMRKMIDDLFAAERGLDFGPENLPQVRTDPFEATWKQVYSFHEGIARTTGGKALFKREPGDEVRDLLSYAAGVYTLYYEPRSHDSLRRRLKIKIDRGGARAIHRDSYKEASIDPPIDFAGSLWVDQQAYDEMTRKLPVMLNVSGAALALAPGNDPPVSFMSLFFEVRGPEDRPMQDLFQIISLPRGRANSISYGDITYPFLLKIPPGSYTLRVDVRDLNGPGRGSYLQAFTVGSVKPDGDGTAGAGY